MPWEKGRNNLNEWKYRPIWINGFLANDARKISYLNSFDIFSRFGVDADDVSFFDEHRGV